MSNEKFVRNIIKTLPKRFAHKVTAIEEAQDLTTMRVDELMENLTTFEMTFDEGESRKKKGLPLKATIEEEYNENLAETIHMLAKKFNKTLRSYYTTLTDKEFDEEEPPEEKVNNFVAYTCHIFVEDKDVNQNIADTLTTDDNVDDGEPTPKELIDNYQLLFIKWSKLTKTFTTSEIERGWLLKVNNKLNKLVDEQKDKILELEGKVKALHKGIKMMNSSTDVLEEILTKEKDCSDNSEIGFPEGDIDKKVKQKVVDNLVLLTHDSRHNQRSRTRCIWWCHYLGTKDTLHHITTNYIRKKRASIHLTSFNG
ncbi:hypothetical protein LIER_41926 [Lithospermum erythrorhizon]|uniref:Gag-pol polyprotein n=1 Tax=Lithospermum erythrorhizon TaxID=34254 RepID=A0AAV3RJT1_LITER